VKTAMMAHNPVDEFSPLEKIRQAEAEVIRQVAAARKAGEQLLSDTSSRMKELLEQAQKTGRQEGEAEYREWILRAEEEARALLAEDRHKSAELRRQGDLRMPDAVRRAVNIVVDREDEEDNGES
jgi:vacuolar-type H+-ATPase subunit H